MRMVGNSSFTGVLVAGVLFWATCVWADDPSITRFDPAGFQRGSEISVEIQGARLADVSKLLMYDSGVEVVELKAESETKVTAKLKIAEDCKPGLHAMRLATRTGISNLRYFGVSPMPETAEAEPNSNFAEPQLAKLNTTINGVITNEDVDYYKIELEAGQKVTIEVEGLRLGTEFFDPFVAILDEKRFELASSDDAALVQQDCLCSLVAERTGSYIVEVRESSFGGNARCQYRMHIGDFPRPVAIVPAGGRPGELISASVVDASGETWETTIQLPDTPGEFAYVAERDGKLAPSPNMLRVTDMPNVLEAEPDDEREKIEAVDAPVAFNGTLAGAGDVDWFKIRAKKDQRLNVVVYGRQVLRSPIDSWLEVHKVGGGRVGVNDDANGPDSGLENFKIPEDGEYLIAIRDQLNEGSLQHAYRIEVSPPTPDLRLTIDELTRYFSQTIAVPRGSQMAVLLRASRKNFGGDLLLQMLDPPEGVHIELASIAANQSYIPLLIKAAPDAPLDSRLTPFWAETTSPDKAPIRGSLDQRTMLVRGQNNRDMWGHASDRLAIAVTEELPYAIHVDQPSVPVVRNGASSFTVRAIRKEGHKDPIYLQAVYNPSGVSTSRSISFKGDATEVNIPITANSKAVIGSYPISILARSKARNAIVWSASDFVTLEVQDSFFDVAFNMAVIEAGQEGNVLVGITAKRPPEGEVELEIVGLPAGVTTTQPKVKWDGTAPHVTFPVSVAADARVAKHKTLYVKVVITRPEGQIQQTAGIGEVQVTAPPVQIAAGPAKPKPKVAATAKPLSRLEQLRLDKKQAAENAGGSDDD